MIGTGAISRTIRGSCIGFIMRAALKIQWGKIYHFDFRPVSRALTQSSWLFLVSALIVPRSFRFAAITDSALSGESSGLCSPVTIARWVVCVLSWDNVLEIRQLAPAIPPSAAAPIAIYPRADPSGSLRRRLHARANLVLFLFLK